MEIRTLHKRLRDELTENARNPHNFYAEALYAKLEISKALADQDTPKVRATAAAYGGLVKRYQSWLIMQITEVSLAGQDTSRNHVRKWQQRLFGKSVRSATLQLYAKPERSGGGRSAPIQLNESIEIQATQFYQDHKDDIKLV